MRSAKLVSRSKRVGQRLPLDRLGQVGDGAELQRALALVGGRDDVDRDVAGGRIVLEQVEHLPAVQLRQAQVQGDGVRPEPPRQGHAGVAAVR